jgi:hypothetical protein
MQRLLLILALLALAVPEFAQNRNISGTITATSNDCSVANSCVTLLKSANDAAVALQITGTFSAGLTFEGSLDYVSAGAAAYWSNISAQPLNATAVVTGAASTGAWQIPATGLTGIRVRATSYTSGTVSIAMQAGTASISPTTVQQGFSGGNWIVQINDGGHHATVDAGGNLHTIGAAYLYNQNDGLQADFGAGNASNETLRTVIASDQAAIQVKQATGTNLHMVCDSGCGSGGGGSNAAAGLTGSAVPTSADYTGGNLAGNLVGIAAYTDSGSSSLGVHVTNTVPVSIADGSDTTLGAKADAKSTATDTTAVSIMSVLKEISAMEQAPASRAVTNAGTFAVQAAESGTWNNRIQDGSGNGLTTNSTTYTSKFALDGNLLGTLGTAFTTAGKVDVKGADGDVFVRQSTASNLNATVVGSLSDNGAANTTNRVGTLPAIAQSNLPSAATAGRNTALRTDLSGTLFASNFPVGLTTYVAVGSGSTAASATDIAVLPGNATNTVVVSQVEVSCTQTTAGINDILLVKRSSADTSGTSSAMTAVPFDSNNAAAVSAPLFYTANPTTGTLVGTVDRQKIGMMATATASPNDVYIWKPNVGQSITLRGTAQQLAVNLNGVTVTGGSCAVTFTWVETTGL